MKTRKIISAALVVLALEGAIVTACIVRLAFSGLDITAWERVEEPDSLDAPEAPEGTPEE